MASRRIVPAVFFESPDFTATGEATGTMDGLWVAFGLEGVSDSPPPSMEVSAAGGKLVVGSGAGGSPSP